MGEPKALLALCLDPPDLTNLENSILVLKEVSLPILVADKLYNKAQNFWVSGLCPLSGILNIRKYSVSETSAFPILR
jgi:hypothetical protein